MAVLFFFVVSTAGIARTQANISMGEDNTPSQGQCSRYPSSGCWGASCNDFYKDLNNLKTAMATCESNPTALVDILGPIKQRCIEAQKIIFYSTADTPEQRVAREQALRANRKERNKEIDLRDRTSDKIDGLISLFRETIQPKLNTPGQAASRIAMWCAQAKAQIPALVTLLNNGIPRRISEQNKNGSMLCIQNEDRQQQEIKRVHRIYDDFMLATQLNRSSEIVATTSAENKYQEEPQSTKSRWTLMGWVKGKLEQRRARKQSQSDSRSHGAE